MNSLIFVQLQKSVISNIVLFDFVTTSSFSSQSVTLHYFFTCFQPVAQTVIETDRLNALLRMEKEMNRQRALAIKTLPEVNEMSQSSSQPTEDDEKDDLDLEDLSATNFFEVNYLF